MITELQNKLNSAIEVEDYLLAAEIRNKIQEVESYKVEKPEITLDTDIIRQTIEEGTPEIKQIQWKNPITGEDSGCWGAHRMDTGALVGGQLLKGSNIHTREHIIQASQAAAEAFAGDCVVTAKMGRNGQRIDIRPPSSYRQAIFGTDTIMPRLSIWGGYGGKSALHAHLGLTRDLCSNEQMMRWVDKMSFRIVHSSKIEDRVEDMIADFGRLAAKFDDGVKAIQEANQRRVNLDAAIEELFKFDEESKTATRNFEKIKDRIRTTYREECEILGYDDCTTDSNAWIAYNAIQNYSQFHMGRKSGTDRVLATLDCPIVKKAEKLILAI